MLLQDRVVVVSGIGPGLGRRIALAMAREGASVVLGARTESYLQDVAAEIEALGSKAAWSRCDISSADDCRRLVDTAVTTFGRVDVLVNSAYAPDVFLTFEEVDLDAWRGIVETNLFGSLQLTKEVLPHLKEQGGGSIVFVNSMITRKPLPRQGGYAVSKGALLTAAQVLARELGEYGIRVNSVVPGWMWGPPVQGYVAWQASQRGVPEQEIIDEITSAIALGRIPPDEECANAVVFLASDMASVITGQTLDVNGGEVFA